jgi:hypothetical protein
MPGTRHPTPGKAGGLLGERLKGAVICEPPEAAGYIPNFI